ncbi:hypothetical protein IE81DRAFT_140709 [Ceraceosorus guamensis]|uniref:RRM domain-containing protein n=1 Tax=Ceraceosorus guamensis TaxID=1522189 RepID=A0A316VY24_9BASI|nr:hypothetical protein IE81DRAFT_140709 [Ceraceosorus guamensis]PWN42224.1 hypothetical protein IE81DRAFT_140709 [Ceraceosorus guamensis]
MMGADRGPPREELPLPTKAPFTAFVGNLSFDVTEGEIESFFAPSQLKGVRIIERDGRPKGFAYVEFDTLDGLKEGLARSGSQMANRTVRVSVADAPKGGAGGFGGGLSSVAEEASQWRRAGPLPSGGDAPPSGFARRGSDRPGFGRQEADGPSGFDNMEVGAGGRSGFGSRFTASPAGRERDGPGGRFASQGTAAQPPAEPSAGDGATNWRTGKPHESLQPPSQPGSRRPSAGPAGNERSPSSFNHRGDATQVDERFASQERMGFGSKMLSTPPDSPSASANGPRRQFGADRRLSNAPGPSAASPSAGDDAETWRSSRRPSAPARGTSQGGDRYASPGGAAAPPAERKKLELKPRSTPVSDNASAPAPATPSTPGAEGAAASRANPFGSAKPVDAAERDRLIEEKIAAREKERKEKEKERKDKERADREAAQAAAPKGPRADGSAKGTSGGASGNAWRRDGSAKPVSNGSLKVEAADTPRVESASQSQAESVETDANQSPAPRAPAPTGAWGGGRKPSGALGAGTAEAQVESVDSSANGNATQKDNPVDAATAGVASISTA